jgi:hypothetical protein
MFKGKRCGAKKRRKDVGDRIVAPRTQVLQAWNAEGAVHRCVVGELGDFTHRSRRVHE